MDKFLMCTVFLAMFGLISSLAVPDDMKEMIKATTKDCQEQSHVSDDILAQLKKHIVVEDAALKQFLLCFHKKCKVQKEDGSFDVELIKSKIAKWTGGNDHAAEVDECFKASEGESDPAEKGFLFTKCLKPKLPIMDD